jgi:prepilin-type N-terminal cleavage/methylation domain-containing protein
VVFIFYMLQYLYIVNMRCMKHTDRGFTLIELLVVIAIIGILSSVVIASLSNARGKGNGAAIKQNLTSIRTQSELFYSDDFTFEGVCDNAIVAAARTDADELNGAGEVRCHDNAGGWAVGADLPGEGAFCVDGSGRGREIDVGGTEYTAFGGVNPPFGTDADDVECN